MLNISMANKKRIVGLAVTPNLGLEACIYNPAAGEVIKYARKFLEYNMASKEIRDIGLFRSAVSDLFDELAISKKDLRVYLVVPNVHSGFKYLEDAEFDDEAIQNMVLSESGKSYIFKQDEPIYSWIDVNKSNEAEAKYIAYTSLQGRAVDAIQDALMDINVSLIGVETSVSAIPRAINATGICTDVIENNRNWDILQINPNGYAIFQMYGQKILDYTEIPFAIMSFEGNDVYSAISSAVAQYLPNYPAKKLVIYSLTDNVSAELLKQEIVFDEEIITINANGFSQTPLVKIADTVLKQQAASMSMNVLGASIPKSDGFATLNVLGDFSYDTIINYGTFNVDTREIRLTSDVISKFSLILSGIFFGAVFIISGILYGAGAIVKIKTDNIKKNISDVKAEIENLNDKLGENIAMLIRQISENNKTAINYYDSLSTDIPAQVWLTYYINKNGKSVGIEGYSLDIENVYNYFNGLKVLTPQSDIKLNKLEVFKEVAGGQSKDADTLVLGGSNTPGAFMFEISNTTYQKSFDIAGNFNQAVQQVHQGANAAQQAKEAKKEEKGPSLVEQITGNTNRQVTVQGLAARIPEVPDVEINLKEIK